MLQKYFLRVEYMLMMGRGYLQKLIIYKFSIC